MTVLEGLHPSAVRFHFLKTLQAEVRACYFLIDRARASADGQGSLWQAVARVEALVRALGDLESSQRYAEAVEERCAEGPSLVPTIPQARRDSTEVASHTPLDGRVGI